MNILSVDTSSTNCSVAVVRENLVLGEININVDLQHSVLLMPLVEELLHRLHMTPADLGALCVSKGPGSFTGLRIGLSALKGMAFGLGLPLYAATSLEILAYGAYGREGLIVPMMDALRGGYYTGFFRFQENRLVTLRGPEILTLDEVRTVVKEYGEKALVLGDVAEKLPMESILEGGHLEMAPPSLCIPRAGNIPFLLTRRIQSGACDDVHALSPLYLRKSQAEYEYEKRKGRLTK